MIVLEVARERDRQIKVEGRTLEGDDKYHTQQLPAAAASYIAHARGQHILATSTWPFSAKSWKPKTERDSLIKAAALLIAEIERRDRAQDCDPRLAPCTGSS